jgi:hypothetical protein
VILNYPGGILGLFSSIPSGLVPLLPAADMCDPTLHECFSEPAAFGSGPDTTLE